MSSSMAKTTGYVGKTDLFKIDPRDIIIQPGFNPRSVFNLDDLKASIRDNGFYLEKPLLLNRRGAALVLIDGERRLRAVLELIDEGVPIVSVPAVLEVSQNEGTLLARALAANSDAVPLEPLDQAEAFKRLGGYGWEPKDIAKAVGCSLSHVYGRLKLLAASQEVVDAMQAGEITTSEAVRVIEKAGKGAGSQQEVLRDTVKVRAEKKASPDRKIAKEPVVSSHETDAASLRHILDDQGVSWVVAQLLEYADKEEILDAVADIVAEAQV